MTEIKVIPIDHMGGDLTVANAARVSFGKHKTTFEDGDKRLIKYLASHEHTSPFGHCFASFHVKAPIFVARQLVKHKFLRWNEISRRYVDTPPEFYISKEWRGKPEDKKQGSSGVRILSWIEEEVKNLNEESFSLYTDLIEGGVAPEQARMILPQSTMTEWYWSGSLDAFSDMCKLRCAPDTQEETRMVADSIYNQMQKWYPVSWEALQGDD